MSLHVQQIANNKQRNKETGNRGELIAASYLKNKGYSVLEMNYRKPWGEIDVIVQMEGIVHFVEVKTVSYGTKTDLEWAVTHGTWRPEENVHPYKIKKLHRAIESWLGEHNWEGKWQIDVAAVRIVPRETYATILVIDNVILS